MPPNAGMTATPRQRRKPLKAPLSQKGGWGDFTPIPTLYTYTYAYTSPGTTANPMLLRGTPLAGGRVAGDAA